MMKKLYENLIYYTLLFCRSIMAEILKSLSMLSKSPTCYQRNPTTFPSKSALQYILTMKLWPTQYETLYKEMCHNIRI